MATYRVLKLSEMPDSGSAMSSTAPPMAAHHRLLGHHGDASAVVLAPMLETSTVSVQAYHKVRWGKKMGLLEAA